jgi:KUP system potassium uptake protein
MRQATATAPSTTSQDASPSHGSRSTNLLALAALGVVFGDIGTSPLYAMQAIFTGDHPVRATPADVYGVISLVAWSLTLMVSIKFVTFIMRADNEGEGGVMALYALVRKTSLERPALKTGLLTAGVIGVALFFADAMITPAISVLSAVEGVEVAAPSLSSIILPVTIGVLAVLFAIQRHGTATVGRLFGPIILLWFAAIAAAGVAEILRNSEALKGLSPSYAVEFFADHPLTAFLSLGAVVLVFTGAEALYADMGHFGRPAISRAWFFVAFPALMLNYIGQASLILDQPGAVSNPFYLLLPGWSRVPMIALATCATLIASQAVISGAFSVTRQVVQLGFLPRMTIRHTSAETIGQVYLPAVNWTLFVLVVGLCLGFGSSGKLATAYGIAVMGTLLIDSILFLVVARTLWRKPRALIVLGVVGFVLLDLLFFGANLPKIAEGGWLPMLVGMAILLLLTTWHRGRELVTAERVRTEGALPDFIDEIHRKGIGTRIKGTAVFLSPSKETTPLALRVAQTRLRAIPEEVVILTIDIGNQPTVPDENRVELDHLGDPDDGFSHLTLHYGYQDNPDVPRGINVARDQGLASFNPYHVTYYLSQTSLVPFGDQGMASWRKDLYLAMNRNAASPVGYFNLPAEHVVGLGGQIRF